MLENVTFTFRSSENRGINVIASYNTQRALENVSVMVQHSNKIILPFSLLFQQEKLDP